MIPVEHTVASGDSCLHLRALKCRVECHIIASLGSFLFAKELRIVNTARCLKTVFVTLAHCAKRKTSREQLRPVVAYLVVYDIFSVLFITIGRFCFPLFVLLCYRKLCDMSARSHNGKRGSDDKCAENVSANTPCETPSGSVGPEEDKDCGGAQTRFGQRSAVVRR